MSKGQILLGTFVIICYFIGYIAGKHDRPSNNSEPLSTEEIINQLLEEESDK